MKRLALFCALLLTSAALHAQIFEGVVKDAKTGEPLPYVNVGIVGKAVGTVTSADGRYSISFTNHAQDSLRISMVGYVTQAFKVDDVLHNLNAHTTTALQPAVNQLAEVKVTNHKWKEVVLGNTTHSKSSNAGFTSNQLGNEIGTIIKIKKSPTYLKRFNASISSPASDSVTLRLNFYTVKDGMPDQLLQNQNILFTINKGQEEVSVDLLPYNIVVNDKFFVSVEWIKNQRGHGLMFSASLLSGSIISRETSQANWEKVGIAGIGFNVLAEY